MAEEKWGILFLFLLFALKVNSALSQHKASSFNCVKRVRYSLYILQGAKSHCVKSVVSPKLSKQQPACMWCALAWGDEILVLQESHQWVATP